MHEILALLPGKTKEANLDKSFAIAVGVAR